MSDTGLATRPQDPRTWLLPVVRLVVGGVFLWLGAHKILSDPQDFLKAVSQYQLLCASPWFNLLVVILPWVEVVAGLALLLGVFLRGAALVSIAMLVVFTTAVFLRALGEHEAQDIAFCAIEFDCGCGQGIVNICSKLWQNGTLVLLGIPILFSSNRRLCLVRK